MLADGGVTSLDPNQNSIVLPICYYNVVEYLRSFYTMWYILVSTPTLLNLHRN